MEHDVDSVTGHPADHQAAADRTRPHPERARQLRDQHLRGAAIPLVVGLFIGAIFVTVFVAAFHDPKPHNLPVAVVAPPQVITALQTQSARHDDAIDIRPYLTSSAARSAVSDRAVFGAFIIDVQGPTLLVAGANGPSVTQTLQGVFTAAAQATRSPLTVVDVQPLSSGDSRGLSVFYGAFGVVLAGFLFGLTSMQLAAKLPLRWRMGSALVFSAAAGLVVAWLLQPVFGALPAPFFTTAVVVGLLALAVGATTMTLLKVFGPTGTFLAAVALLVFGNATSTGILPAQYLPGWLEPMTAVLPVGVAVRGLRGAAYFHDDGVASAVLVLTAWALVAALVFAAGDLVQRHRQHPRHEATA